MEADLGKQVIPPYHGDDLATRYNPVVRHIKACCHAGAYCAMVGEDGGGK